MEYLKINGVDFSPYVSGLSIGLKHNYTKQTNAAGDSVIDYINTKRTINVEIISTMLSKFITLYNSITSVIAIVEVISTIDGKLKTDTYTCLLPSIDYDYYTIQNQNNIRIKDFKIKLTEV